MTITPFTIAIPDAAIADLRERLAMIRWPHELTANADRGQPRALVERLATEWGQFDWRAAEARLNALPHFLTEIDGQTIHFVHLESPRPDATPLLLVHGWPATFTEYLDVAKRLADPEPGAPAFHCVIPSLPGFGFSTPLATPGWDSTRTARAFDRLMRELGYPRYGYVGNDVGAIIGKELGVLAPDGLRGVHLQQIFAFPAAESGWSQLDTFEAEGMANAEAWQAANGYQRIQQTRPATLAYGLVDSPVAQLSWNMELFYGFDASREALVDTARFLTDVSIYWFTASGGSAANIYLEDERSGAGDDQRPNPTPTGVAVFPDDFRSVRAFASANNHVVHWSQMPRGGHFAAIEQPELLADDIRAFFSAL